MTAPGDPLARLRPQITPLAVPLVVVTGCGADGTCTATVLQGAASAADRLVPPPGAGAMNGRAAVTHSGSTVWALSVDDGTTQLDRGAADRSSDVVALPAACP